MKLILWIFACIAVPFMAQETTKPAEKPAAEAATTQSPVPSAESSLGGSIDLGYRWQTGIGGSADAYRTLVNLGSGPKLLGADLTLLDPKHRIFDVMHVRASSWGDDPYSTLHVDLKRTKLYELNVDYRNFAYFSSLPSYADPLLSRGIVLSEQTFDQRRRFTGLTLDLLPGNWYIPYFAFDRDSSSGTGTSVFVSTGNEYPVPSKLNDATNLIRGGVRFELRRFHATLEEGATSYSEDQSLYQTSTNYGNLGIQKLDLTNLLATYGISGNSVYSKGLFSASAKPWLDLYGQFLYSQPSSDVNYQQTAAGVFQSGLLYYSSQQFLLAASAKMPHTMASAGAEITPKQRVRILESWLTDRLHNASSASSALTLGYSTTAAQLAASLASNYSQQQVDVLIDASSKVMLRGGYRYVWGDARDVTLPLAGLAHADRGELRRNVGLWAITYRPLQKISMTAEAEIASSGGTYFRTSLYNYQKFRGHARYSATSTLNLAADVTILRNQNPAAGLNYDYLANQMSLSAMWSPAKVKAFDVQASYTRSTIHSDIAYLSPGDGSSQQSRYRDNGHVASTLLNWTPPHSTARVSAGGSLFTTSGSRPSTFFQPIANVRIPWGKKVSWFGEWRYYEYGETFYLYEGFRSHLITTGLRFTR